jgi:APA family basic amino acid/polyamine antiporter
VTPSTADSVLDRRLGPLDAAVIVISNVIGVGIFTTPGIVATMLPNPAVMLAVWAVGGALAFAGALAYAELAARRPQAGGEYVYLRESFGGLAAFLTGWTSFVAGFSGAIAAGAVGLTAYLDRLLPGAGHSSAIAIAIIIGLALIHARGLGPGRIVQTSLTVLKVGALIAFVVIGFAIGRSPQPVAAAVPSAPVRLPMLLLALVPIMFSYSGWNAAVYVAEEVREPSRNVPLGLAIGTLTVVALYLSLNALYLRVVPHAELSGTISVGELAAARLFGPAAATMFAIVAIIIILSSISAMTVAGPRVYFAMARDGAFLPAAARVHPRYRTPAVAIMGQAIWSAVLVLSGTFDQLLTYTGFAIILFSALAVLSLFFVRRLGEDTKTFRAWGYPWAPAVFSLVGFAIVGNTIVNAPRPAFAGLAVMFAGVPLYLWTKRKNRSRLETAD